MTSTIVCGVDGSSRSHAAARLTGRLADASGQAVQYVYATGSAEFGYAFYSAKRVRESLVAAIEREVSLRVMPGTPGEQLLLAARGASMLVLGIRRRGALSRAIRPGVATTVARAAAVPVIVAPDGLDDVVHVVVPSRLPIAPAGGAPPPGLPASARERGTEAAALLDDIASAVTAGAAIPCRTRVVHGDVGRALGAVADEEDAFLIALGPSRSRARGRALGRRCARRLVRSRRAVAVFPAAERVFTFDDPQTEPTAARTSR